MMWGRAIAGFIVETPPLPLINWDASKWNARMQIEHVSAIKIKLSNKKVIGSL
jgi:hypothetical protein